MPFSKDYIFSCRKINALSYLCKVRLCTKNVLFSHLCGYGRLQEAFPEPFGDDAHHILSSPVLAVGEAVADVVLVGFVIVDGTDDYKDYGQGSDTSADHHHRVPAHLI